MKTVLGIDVGMKGALSFYDGVELICYDMPTFERNKTHRLDGHRIAEIVKTNQPTHAWIEQVNAFGMGATSAYNFGFGCGVIEGVFSSLGVPFSYVTPQVWKKAMGCPKEKDGARARATQLFPTFADNWSLKRQDGVAEASLIALYGFNKELK